MTLQGENIHTREKRTGPILDNLANGTRAPILIHNNSDVISCNDAHALQHHLVSTAVSLRPLQSMVQAILALIMVLERHSMWECTALEVSS